MMESGCQVEKVVGLATAYPMGGISRNQEGNPVSEELEPPSMMTAETSDRPLPPDLLARLEGVSAQRLWIAVLEQAFSDYYGDIPSEGPAHYRQALLAQCRRSAKAWFLSESQEMGSFRWIADLFDLNARAVRKRLFKGPRIASVEALEESQVGMAAIAGVGEGAPRAEVRAAA
jgi:hypothetical protein